MPTAFLSGLLFGAGLLLSGMANPAKVLGFLDVTGAWDPSLAIVMAAAVPVAAIGFAWQRRLQAQPWHPFARDAIAAIDRRLLAGAALFGIGWGLAGYCPGPALVASVLATPSALLFTIAMLAGMALHSLQERRRRPAENRS
jgi:uncharacterized membrane protein YedE/YeeE